MEGEKYWCPEIGDILKFESERKADEVDEDQNGENKEEQFEGEKAPKFYYDFSWIQCVDMNRINFESMQFVMKRMKYRFGIGIVISSKCQRLEMEWSDDRKMMIYYVPYRQHWNKHDVRDFIKFMNPKQFIYPLNDNFTQNAVERQRIQMTYGVEEIYREQELSRFAMKINEKSKGFLHHQNGDGKNNGHHRPKWMNEQWDQQSVSGKGKRQRDGKEENEKRGCPWNLVRNRNDNRKEQQQNRKRRRVDGHGERRNGRFPSYYFCDSQEEWHSVYEEDKGAEYNDDIVKDSKSIVKESRPIDTISVD